MSVIQVRTLSLGVPVRTLRVCRESEALDRRAADPMLQVQLQGEMPSQFSPKLGLPQKVSEVFQTHTTPTDKDLWRGNPVVNA